MGDTGAHTGRQPRSRRRGARLESDIYEATLQELLEVGYGRLTFDGVARRAGAGRMSLYRRWQDRPQMVAGALRHALPPLTSIPEESDLRTGLVALLIPMFHASQKAASIVLEVAAAIIAGRADEDLAHLVRTEILNQRLASLERVLALARARGDISASADIRLLARSGPALLFQHMLFYGESPDADDIAHVVDHLVMPAAMGANEEC